MNTSAVYLSFYHKHFRCDDSRTHIILCVNVMCVEEIHDHGQMDFYLNITYICWTEWCEYSAYDLHFYFEITTFGLITAFDILKFIQNFACVFYSN